MAAGIPDDLFWRCTAEELEALVDAFREREEARERAAVLRAGIVAAAVYNANPFRRRGSRAVRPDDFLAQPVRIVSPAEARAALSAWAAGVNRGRT